MSRRGEGRRFEVVAVQARRSELCEVRTSPMPASLREARHSARTARPNPVGNAPCARSAPPISFGPSSEAPIRCVCLEVGGAAGNEPSDACATMRRATGDFPICWKYNRRKGRPDGTLVEGREATASRRSAGRARWTRTDDEKSAHEASCKQPATPGRKRA